jgi:hypothetical protein
MRSNAATVLKLLIDSINQHLPPSKSMHTLWMANSRYPLQQTSSLPLPLLLLPLPLLLLLPLPLPLLYLLHMLLPPLQLLLRQRCIPAVSRRTLPSSTQAQHRRGTHHVGGEHHQLSAAVLILQGAVPLLLPPAPYGSTQQHSAPERGIPLRSHNQSSWDQPRTIVTCKPAS